PLGYIDPATRTVSGATPWQILAYESYTWENFLFSSTIMVPDEQTMTLFIPLNARFVAVLKCGLENLVSGVLTNSSLENPEGVGYLVTESEFRLTYTALHIVRDLYNLLKSRSAILSTFRINDPLINLTRSKIESVLPKIYNSLENARFSEAYSLIYSAWNWEVQCYFQVARVINDVNMSAFFFFALLVPFSIIVEKAILHATDKNRIIGVIGIFTLMTMIFCFFHPGAHLSGNAPVVITGVIMIVSAIIILTAFSQETLNVLKKIRTKILGFHFVERGQLSFYFTSLSIGIENLRRRRLRTLLTLITLILLTFALTSFTTIFPTLFPKESEVPEIKPSYQGILIRRAQGEPGRDLGKLLMEHIKAMVKEGAVVAPRYYYYPPLLTFFGQCEITGFNSTYAILAVLGLSPEEKDVTGVNELLEAGRWFISSDHYACIITDKVAKGLLVSPGDTIIFQGIKLTVVGIVNSALSNLLIDLDGRLYTPLDPRYLVGLTPQSLALTEFSEQYIPLTWDEILIVPSSLAESLGAYLSSIAIRIDDEVLIKKISQELSMMMYGFDIWFSHNNRIFVIRRSAVYEMGGLWAYLIPIIIISMLTALLTMLGSVHERMREIGIFSSLGLSPKQVAVLFFAESAFFAVVSGIVGYLMSVGAVYIIYALDIFQHGLYSNYAATYVIILLSLLMSVTLLSTLYPALKASKLVTPSLERKWRVLTKPTGVEWEIPLPFYAVSKEEAIGLLRYISEYFEAQMLESGAEIFITRSIEFKPEEEKVFARVALAPFEMGVVQEVTLRTFISPDSGKYSFALRLKRVSGLHEVWLTRVRNFVDEVRKQFLIWGSLSREEKNKYIARELKSKSLTKNY
ncbi:MAG: FtsX-like permease family protein, partial [Candidatus Bathyarchaeia archaeon]